MSFAALSAVGEASASDAIDATLSSSHTQSEQINTSPPRAEMGMIEHDGSGDTKRGPAPPAAREPMPRRAQVTPWLVSGVGRSPCASI
eukprot:2673657-Prymnesium_polylepis.1